MRGLPTTLTKSSNFFFLYIKYEHYNFLYYLNSYAIYLFMIAPLRSESIDVKRVKV